MKPKGLNRDERLNRLPVEVAAHLTGNEYKFADYVMYRGALNRYQIYTTTMVKELGMDKSTVLKLCKNFKERGWLKQDDDKHYHLDYGVAHRWIWEVLDGKPATKSKAQDFPQRGGNIQPSAVENSDQTDGGNLPLRFGGENPPASGGKNPPDLVENSDPTSNREEIEKELVKEDSKNISNKSRGIWDDFDLVMSGSAKLNKAPSEYTSKEISFLLDNPSSVLNIQELASYVLRYHENFSDEDYRKATALKFQSN